MAALASYLDARAHAGQWRVRIEDIDTPRVVPGADQVILAQLAALGMRADGEIWYQSQRDEAYLDAFHALSSAGRIYGCACTRREIADSALRHGALREDGERPYPGTCRAGLAPGRQARAWRVWVPTLGVTRFEDRWQGEQGQDVAQEVGDFILRRADGLWAYQLAVVVDDGAQGVTDVVRGADLLSSTARQQVLAGMLGLPVPRVMHVPLIRDPHSGLKLSKQNGAPSLDISQPLACLGQAWQALGFAPFEASDLAAFWGRAIDGWARRFGVV